MKKRKNLKKRFKKEEKVKEINDLIAGEIAPQMEKLRKERETYLIWKSNEAEL